MWARALLVALVAGAWAASPSAQAPQSADAIAALIARLEQAGLAGDRAAILAQGSQPRPPELEEFADLAVPAPARFIIKERDRSPIREGAERVLLEVFAQRGNEARITTWRFDLQRGVQTGEWSIAGIERLSNISGLYRLELDPAKQFDVQHLTVRGPDLTLELPKGTAFVAEVDEGPTAIVLVGRGRMRFSPADPAEQTQLRIFAGRPALEAEFEAAFIRIRPGDLDSRFGKGSLLPRPVSQRDFRRARDLFEDHVGQSLRLDLSDFSRERWSLTPSPGDLIAEVRTRRHGTLTYARSVKEAEDVSLFDRRRRRNISVYASAEKMASRGRFFDEDTLVEYDVLHHEIEAFFDPDRVWIDGRSRMRIRVQSLALSTLTLRLAEPLTVRSIVSPDLGRLLHLRVVGQNSVIVNLPVTATRGSELDLFVAYSGRLEPQALEREAITAGGQVQEEIQIRIEPQWLYSNRSYWHPQSTVTDYATGRLRIIVPPGYGVVASGTPAGPAAPAPGPVPAGERPNQMFVFESDRPSRYFGCAISRLAHVTTVPLDVPSAPANIDDGEDPGRLTLSVQANPRQSGRGRNLADRAANILRFYASLVGDSPYPSFTLMVGEAELPGGHSPPYFAVVNHTLPMVPVSWRNDPVSFDNYPSFFLAHEIAHQWWGQAVGWKNYHEQWLSEGFAQYFAALYAADERGDTLLENLLRQMRRWAIEQSSQGPVYLGYRLGHIEGDARVYRALIYNKGAMVLHMLRRLVGDKVFFGGLRAYYQAWRFRKAGTDDFRIAMESAGAPDLNTFFEAWIYGTTVPELHFSYDIQPESAVLRFEHRREVVPVPVTVTISYADESAEHFVVPVVERSMERTVPLKGPVRRIDVNRDNAALAEFTR